MRWYQILRELRMEISTMIMLSGILLTVFTVNHYFLRSSLPAFFLNIDDHIGAWIVWVAVIGPLLLLIGVFYFQDTIRKRREFRRLIDTDSKAKFFRNQARLTEIAQVLGNEYWGRMEQKAAEFNLK